MVSRISFITLLLSFFTLFSSTTRKDAITKLEMHLSAFGVESDDFPSIDVYIDFINDSSNCHKWYYNPKHKDSTYRLTSAEMKTILSLLETTDLNEIKTTYKSQMSDQPTSTAIIFAGDRKIVINDYGLQADDPLKSMYKLVYRF